MAKQKTTPPGKTRTRQHVIADLAVNHLERHVLRCGWTLQRIQADYGYDHTMWTYSKTGEIESGINYFQVKASDNLRLLKDGTAISWTISQRDLRLWLRETYPVILVVYDGSSDKSYWLYVQAYFSQRPAVELFSASQTINVQVPICNRIDRRAIRKIAGFKWRILDQMRGDIHHHV